MQWASGRNFSASLLHKPHLNEVLPVCINRIKGAVLVDTGCSRSLVSRMLCHSWKRKEVDVLTEVDMITDVTLRCCGFGVIQVGVSDRLPIDVVVLVVDRKLLEYDL